jgi:hypothetical protein
LLYYFKKEKEKKDFLVSLIEYFDLVWCLHNDFWRTLILFDDTYDLHFFAQVIGIWRVWESWYIAGKDHSSTILVAWVEIEETHSTGVVGIDNCPLNNHVLIVVVSTSAQVITGRFVSQFVQERGWKTLSLHNPVSDIPLIDYYDLCQ